MYSRWWAIHRRIRVLPDRRAFFCADRICCWIISVPVSMLPKGIRRLAGRTLAVTNGLFALYQGQANFATAICGDWETDQYNLPFVPKMLPGMEVQVYHIVNRPIGIYTAPGNPKGITCVEDFAREDVRMVNREKGSGIRVLTDSLFLRAGLSAAEINGYDCIEHSHMAAAAAVARGEADCAVGNERSVLGPEVVLSR